MEKADRSFEVDQIGKMVSLNPLPLPMSTISWRQLGVHFASEKQLSLTFWLDKKGFIKFLTIGHFTCRTLWSYTFKRWRPKENKVLLQGHTAILWLSQAQKLEPILLFIEWEPFL